MSKRDYSGYPIASQLSQVAGQLAVDYFKAHYAPNLSQASTLTAEAQLANSYLSSEQAQTKRLPPSRYRLHPAKVLKCDPLFKDMFFPLRTIESSFGFTSVSGRIGQLNIGGAVPALQARDHAAAGGKWRGLAVFQCRYTDETVNTNTAHILSSDAQDLGTFKQTPGSTDYDNVKSQFRSFANAPASNYQENGSGDAPVDICQSAVEHPFSTVNGNRTPIAPSQMFVGRTALNLSTIERDAYYNMPYVPAPLLIQANGVSDPENVGPNTLEGSRLLPFTWQQNDGYSLKRGGTGVGADNYANQFTNALFRIVDGYIHLDITNSDSTTCVVEVVINSMKKTNENHTINDFFKAVHDAVKSKVTASISDFISKLEPTTHTQAGGWQAFYDPEYPLLKVPSSTGKNVKSIATEVHRSNHVLAPGQTKTVKIALGSLWYTPEGKTDYTPDGSGCVPMKQCNAGSLVFAIGHSGFDCMEAIIPDNGATQINGGWKFPSYSGDQMSNTGFWAGKSRSPSSIIIRGEYQERYYPLSFKPRNNTIRRNTHTPSYYIDGGNEGTGRNIAIPGEMIVANRVATATEDGTRSVSS